MRPTFHLVPTATWLDSSVYEPYVAESLADEGFIHCTDGETELLATANRHYRTDPRPFVVLTIDLDRVGAPWRTEDPGRIYPHVFGPIAREAIIAVRRLERAVDGTFEGVGDRPS